MKIEGTRIRSIKFLDRVEKVENKKIGVILEDFNIPSELNEKESCKFRPNIKWGRNSMKNTIGEFLIDKDLPKINKYINTIEWHWKQYKGRDLEDMYDFFDVYRNVYQKKFIEPLEIDFIFIKEKNIIYADIQLKDYENNEKKVLLAANILLEKFGFFQILDEDFNEYIPNEGFKKYYWEILPPGEEIWDSIGEKKYTAPFENEKRKRASFDSYRIATFLEKNPKEKYIGINEFQDYLVFVFDEICVLETQKYGNATYIIQKNNWKSVSMMTKKDVLNSEYIIDRIVHNQSWRKKIDTII